MAEEKGWWEAKDSPEVIPLEPFEGGSARLDEDDPESLNWPEDAWEIGAEHADRHEDLSLEPASWWDRFVTVLAVTTLLFMLFW